MTHRSRTWADLTTVALLTWMGIQTIRTYLTMGGWVLGTGLSRVELGVLLLGLWGIGLLGWPVVQALGRWTPALLFGALFTLYRAFPGPYLSPVFGCLALATWLWLLPTALRAISLRGRSGLILPGMLLGLAGQVGLQTALHGLDLTLLQGLGPGLIALGLALALALALYLGGPVPEPGEEEQDLPGWGLIAWGPYLALQLTLLTNLGRIAWQADWELSSAAALALAGLALGALLASLSAPRWLRALAGLATVGLLAQPAWLAGAGVWLLLVAQALLPLALAPAFAPLPGRRVERTYLWVGLGSLLGISLLLLFYLRAEWKLFWPIMAGAAALPGLLTHAGTHKSPSWPAAGVITSIGLVAVPLALQPAPAQSPSPAPATLTAMSYNIHQLFDWWGTPSPAGIAQVIAEARPDLIGLQEASRGWDFTGGVEMVAWLRWRFPDYQVLWGKTEGDLVGNVILSRYPAAESGWALYHMLSADLQRGFQWVRLQTEQGELLFINTHLSAWRHEEPDRIAQAEQLLAFWREQGSPPLLLLGDLNASPGSAPIARLEAGGLIDLPSSLGLGLTPTFPAGNPRARLDYAFISPELIPLSAEVVESLASDHRPLLIRTQLPRK